MLQLQCILEEGKKPQNLEEAKDSLKDSSQDVRNLINI